jgi:hypothetical protein
MKPRDKRRTVLLVALEWKQLSLLPKELFYAIVNAPFVFLKRPVAITVMTIVIWGSFAATYISLDRLDGIRSQDALFVFVTAGLFIQGLFLSTWCGSLNRAYWRYGKSFAKDAARFHSKRKKIRHRILQPTPKKKH